MLLHHFGGVYADIDCECVASFEPIMKENRIVVGKDPFRTHPSSRISAAALSAVQRTMASPPGHPFWMHLLSMMPGLAHAKDVLDATGPCLLTSASAVSAIRKRSPFNLPACSRGVDGHEPRRR